MAILRSNFLRVPLYTPFFVTLGIVTVRILVLRRLRSLCLIRLLLTALLECRPLQMAHVILFLLSWLLKIFRSVLRMYLLPLLAAPLAYRVSLNNFSSLFWCLLFHSQPFSKIISIICGKWILQLMLLSEVRDMLSDSLFPKINELVIEVPCWVKARFPGFWTRWGTQSVLLHNGVLTRRFYQFRMLAHPELVVQL